MNTTEKNGLAKLRPQVAKTGKSQDAFASMLQSADKAVARGWQLRKGGTSTSARNGRRHIYASKDGQETRIWSGVRMSAGWFSPLTSVQLDEISARIEALS